jgi:hypothetical protein
MRIMFVCVLVTGFTTLLVGLMAGGVALLFDLSAPEPIIALSVVVFGCPLGLVRGLQLASLRRDQLLTRLAEAERAVIALGLISALGCVVGLLGEGRGMPAALAIIATVGSAIATVCVVLRRPRSAPLRRVPLYRRGRS